MSLVTFLGIYFVREAGIDLATVGVAFLCENLLRGLAAPFFGARPTASAAGRCCSAPRWSRRRCCRAFCWCEGPA